jgi:hypothetical protein
MYLSFVWKPVNIFSGRRHHSLSADRFCGLAQSTCRRAYSGKRALNNNIETKTVAIGEQWNAWVAKSRKPEPTS